MKKIFLLMLSFVFLFASNVIVSVNGHKITDDIVPGYNRFNPVQKEMLKQQLINEELLMSYALKSGITKDKQFKKIFEAQKKRIEQAYKQKFNKSLTKEQIRNIKGSVALNLLLAKKAQKIKISDKEAKAFYQKNKDKFKTPRMVEIATIATKDKKEALKILKELKKSKNVAAKLMKIAKQKHQRGYLGWVPEQAFPKDVFKKIYVAKPNTLLSKPIEVKGVYNIVYLVNKKKAGMAKFKDVKDRLKMFLAQQKVAKWSQEKLKELRKKAVIK